MFCIYPSTCVSSKPAIGDISDLSFQSQINPFHNFDLKVITSIKGKNFSEPRFTVPLVYCGLRELRERIETVKNTQKVTEAMKLVAAAKVRRAQEAVVSGRPFAEALVDVLFNISQQMELDEMDVPLTIVRPVIKVALVVISGDRGLCGGFNAGILKKAEARVKELKNLGVDCTLISVGNKGNSYFRPRDNCSRYRFVEGVSFPWTKRSFSGHESSISLSQRTLWKMQIRSSAP